MDTLTMSLMLLTYFIGLSIGYYIGHVKGGIKARRDIRKLSSNHDAQDKKNSRNKNA